MPYKNLYSRNSLEIKKIPSTYVYYGVSLTNILENAILILLFLVIKKITDKTSPQNTKN